MKDQSGIPIPDDLQGEYRKRQNLDLYDNALICRLIERIGRVEAENAALKKPVTDIARRECEQCGTQMDGVGYALDREARIVFNCPKCGNQELGATRQEWDTFLRNDAAQIRSREAQPREGANP